MITLTIIVGCTFCVVPVRLLVTVVEAVSPVTVLFVDDVLTELPIHAEVPAIWPPVPPGCVNV